jgi:O-antigen/teichoic acid export membrane protein
VVVAARRTPAALSWRLVRQAGRRLTWGMADQAMGALTNFLLSIFIARTLGATQFGAFSVAFVTYGLVLNASRGLAVDPLLIRFSGTYLPTWRRAVAGATGTALLVGLVTGACVLAAGSLFDNATGRAFVALGLTLPGLMLQDSWRHSFFALRRGYHAFINDTVWAVVLIPLLVFLKISGHANVFWLVLAWGVGAAVGAAIGILQARVVPDLAGAVKWLWRHRDLGPHYLAANTVSNASNTLRSYALTIILSLAAVGYIQAAGTLMGPFNIVLVGLSLVMVPEAVRLLHRSPRQLPLFCAGISAGLALLAVTWGAVLLVALPRGLGHLLLGSLWRPTYPLVVPATLAVASSCVATGAFLGLTGLGAARRNLRASIFNAVLLLACGLVGAVTGGTLGTMRWYAAASWLAALVTWWQLRHALQESSTVPVPRWLWPGRGRG